MPQFSSFNILLPIFELFKKFAYLVGNLSFADYLVRMFLEYQSRVAITWLNASVYDAIFPFFFPIRQNVQ